MAQMLGVIVRITHNDLNVSVMDVECGSIMNHAVLTLPTDEAKSFEDGDLVVIKITKY